MSEWKLISPMLDEFAMGDPISSHHGVRCCPAMKNDSDDRYIVKIISVPASPAQLDALLLTGAYPDEESALSYFKTVADGIIAEVNTLKELSSVEGFLNFEDMQLVPMEDGKGFDIYLLSPYRRSLSKHFVRNPMTHLGAINLGLDLCAALAVCRRSGFLCVDLKPNNVFVTLDQEYRIGDIGFVRLDSMKYASLPDRYRSAYTAPEIADAFSALNDTMDVYALGLILYQAYNNGELPFSGDVAPLEVFPAPLFADYEMSEIILKACAPDPKDRWQDPVEMGQALVGYMQRNGANDTPIVPPAAPAVHNDDENEVSSQDVSETEVQSADTVAENPDPLYHEDTDGNLSFLESIEADEFDLEQDGAEFSYDELSQEVSEMLNQADELADHSVPDPVVTPEPIEINVQEILPEEDKEDDPPIPEEDQTADTSCDVNAEDSVESESEESEETNAPATAEEAEETEAPKKKKGRRWLAVCIPILFIMALLAGGIYYYLNYYLQPIESIVASGSEDSLTVYVTSLIDESKLSVVCSDAYGNQITAPVSDGKAVFTNLIPDTGYNIYVQIDGFHKLTGQTSAGYSTPVQTSIVQFNAVTGSEDGSVILSFTVDGKDAENWTVSYSAEGEEAQSATFSAHTVTLTGLTIGKEYTFTLDSDEDLYLTGIDQITYTASTLVYAQELAVVSCIDNTLVATWSAPEDAAIDSWTVRCYNNDTYNETIITTDTTATFENLNHSESFTVEVIAAGMSVSQRVYVPENSVTVTDLKLESVDTQGINLRWNTSQEIPESGWVLQYQIDGTDIKSSLTCTENAARISPVIPGCSYSISLQDSNGNSLLGGQIRCDVPDAVDFSGTFGSRSVTRKNLVFNMCKTPTKTNWTYKNVKSGDYTTEFTSGQKASFVIRISTAYKQDNTNIDISYVVRDANGNPVSIALQTFTWTQMWNKYYCELDIPNMPESAGSYTISVYFNGALANEQSFTITA